MPWLDRLPASLRRLYRASEPDPKDMSKATWPQEQQLMALHARRYPQEEPARGLGGFLRAHRWAVSCGAAALGLAAACQVPIDYDHNFGATVWCDAVGKDTFEGPAARELADRLRAHTGAEGVAVRIHADEAKAAMRVDLWGADPEHAGLAELVALPGASCSVEPMVETVHGTLGGRLGLELFDLDLLDHSDVEAARAQILERLEARGLKGDAQVEISDLGDGRREIKVRIEAESTGPVLEDRAGL